MNQSDTQKTPHVNKSKRSRECDPERHRYYISVLLLRKLTLLDKLVRKHGFPRNIRLPPQRNKISFFTLLYTPQTKHTKGQPLILLHHIRRMTQARFTQNKLTFLEDSGFSLWTLSNSFLSRFSKALSSAPW
jgi:hypothetical protein